MNPKKVRPNKPCGALQTLLDDFGVGVVDIYHNASNDGKLTGILGWYYFVDNEGVTAYFSTEKAALRFRLAEINRMLNG